MSDDRRRPMKRGLSALMADVGVEAMDAAQRDARTLPIELIKPNPDQPRRSFDEAQLDELSQSIKRRGILQPLLVRPRADEPGTYEIIAGERRWRAAQKAGLHVVPIIEKAFDDAEVLEVAIVENIQRSDLNPLEEAVGFRHLMDRYSHTQEQVAEILGKSRSHVANLMRLLKLPDAVQDHVRTGTLSAGHARTLITSNDPEGLARKAIAEGLSVRDLERLVADTKGKTATPARPRTSPADADTKALEGDLSSALGMRVKIDHGAAGDGGKVTISYRTLDDLDGLCALLSNGLERD